MALIRLLRLHEVWSHHLPSCLCNNTFFCLISYIFINWSKFQRRVSRLQRERAPSNPKKLAPWCQKRSTIPWKFQIHPFAWPLFLISNACMFPHQPLMNCAQIETLVTREVCEEPAGPVCKTVKTFEVEEICAPNKVEISTQKDIFTNKHKIRSHPSNKENPLFNISTGSKAYYSQNTGAPELNIENISKLCRWRNVVRSPRKWRRRWRLKT